jgi:hypothetical protein
VNQLEQLLVIYEIVFCQQFLVFLSQLEQLLVNLIRTTTVL